MDYPSLSQAELNAAALEYFIYQPVDKQMIRYLAKAASNVIQCDPNMMPPRQQQSPRRDTSPRAVRSSDGALPSVEEFITQLVVSSNVQVPTLMSSLVYLRRLKSRLQPQAKGLRCTTHRIFLASLILAAKYLNDSSPKNKHWANYSVVQNHAYNFGFSRTEVNLMEKQLLFLLDWDLRISEEDLYYELDPFLEPIRNHIAAKHARKWQRKQEQLMRERMLEEERLARLREREEEARMWMALVQPKPQVFSHSEEEELSAASATSPSDLDSFEDSRSRTTSAAHSRSSSRDTSPPALSSSYSSSSSSSRATSPCHSEADIATYPHHHQDPHILCDSPSRMDDVLVDDDDEGCRPIPPEKDEIYAMHAAALARAQKNRAPGMLPFEITAEDLRALEAAQQQLGRKRPHRGVLGRVFGARA
ncbi:hypothetical protein VTJ04DRAFT_10283 [Mycothermus thermophilus]|uniref:uncharacterized protein n=1 Tax=Humicola insolens TaxID=85995 RepID=UPI0037420DB6